MTLREALDMGHNLYGQKERPIARALLQAAIQEMETALSLNKAAIRKAMAQMQADLERIRANNIW